MRNAGRVAAVLAVIAGCLPAPFAAGAELVPSIDLNYIYDQENLAGAVNASTKFQQVYQIKYATTLTSALDFQGSVKLDLDDKWSTSEATTSRIAPTLELGVKGSEMAVKFSYSGAITSTDQFHETAESEKVSNSADFDLELTPLFWPEVKLKLQRKRDYELQAEDGTDRSVELQLRDEVFTGLVLEYMFKLGESVDVLPVRGRSDSVDWSLKTTYRQQLYGGTDFEVSHEIKESYQETSSRDVFTTLDESYTQSFRGRLRNSLDLTPLLNLVLSWEYGLDQDLLQLEYDYKVDNKYALDLRFDVFPALKLTAGAKRDTTRTVPVPGQETKEEVVDAVRGGFDFVATESLRFSGKAEFKSKASIAENTGGSVDRTTEENYELGMRHKVGDFWDLNVNGSYVQSFVDGYVESEESKLKATLKLTRGNLTVEPEYEATREADWEDVGDPSTQRSISDLRIKIDYKLQVLEMLTATFAHEYGTKLTRELDEFLNFERELQLSESTRLNLLLVDFIEGLRVEGSVERAGSDTEDDQDPQIVDVAYSLKLDWQVKELTLGSSFKYTSKGEDFDDLNLTAKIAWKNPRFGASGEYEFGKVYSEETDEDRTLTLKLFYTF
jgi:hypothetical protein